MIDTDAFQFGLSAFMLGMSVFCASSLLMRSENRRVSWPLGAFFAVQSVTLLPIIVVMLDAQNALGFFHLALEFLGIPLLMMQTPLFWLYTRALITEGDRWHIRCKALHLAPIVFAVLVYVFFLLLPRDLAEGLAEGQPREGRLTALFVFCFYAVTVTFYLQVGVYLVMIVRALSTYRLRLKDLFASTEGRELTWIWWIAAGSVVFLCYSVVGLLLPLAGLPVLQFSSETSIYLTALFTVPVMWIVALWGLRQQPGLSRYATQIHHEERLNAETSAKYERSALSEGQANRIAAKIQSAMDKDLLYRDPNLSLWDLANHIGATSNYLSQTLNETLGQSFFDYINDARIKHALHQMENTDQTVLVIAYDVGFNSRSAFYRAFKRHTGQTPTQWRNGLKSNAATIAERLS